MGIDERRERERERRRTDILEAAWRVAERLGWAGFSVERVAKEAELGRATVYDYFESLEALVLELGRCALDELGERLTTAELLEEALDVPVRFAQKRPAAFELLFPTAQDPRPAFSASPLVAMRAEARELVARLLRLASRSRATLPEDARSAEAFLSAISLAGAVVPELKQSTTLRRRWQKFCLDEAATPKPRKKRG